nr:MAG TPA: hypothetical protein [Caudoviricetes sp.]
MGHRQNTNRKNEFRKCYQINKLRGGARHGKCKTIT